jgi:hypothetical protein
MHGQLFFLACWQGFFALFIQSIDHRLHDWDHRAELGNSCQGKAQAGRVQLLSDESCGMLTCGPSSLRARRQVTRVSMCRSAPGLAVLNEKENGSPIHPVQQPHCVRPHTFPLRASATIRTIAVPAAGEAVLAWSQPPTPSGRGSAGSKNKRHSQQKQAAAQVLPQSRKENSLCL